MADEQYVRIIHKCSWERETFGFYWPATEENIEGIKAAAAAMPDWYNRGSYIFDPEPKKLPSDGGYNSYMARVNRVGETDWDTLVAGILTLEKPPEEQRFFSPTWEQDPFYKGRGLAIVKNP